MKAFKKFLTVGVAAVMSFSVVSFAACSDGEDEEVKVSKEEVAQIVSSISAQSANYAELNGTGTIGYTETETSYTKQKALNDKNTSTMTINADVKGKLNIIDGDADITATLKNGAESIYTYEFLRDWVATTYTSPTAVTNFSGVTLDYAGDIKEQIGEALGSSEIELGQMASMLLVPLSSMDLSLAAELDAVTKKGDVLTVDGNLMIYNQVQKILAFINKINDDTTLGEILAFNEIKGSIDESGLDGETMQLLLLSMVASIGETELEDGSTIADFLEEAGIDLNEFIVEADPNSTAYQYIVKLLSSDKLNDLIADIAAEYEITVPDILDIDINYIKALIALATGTDATTIPGMAAIKVMVGEFTSGITATECKISVNMNSANATAPVVSSSDLISYVSIKELKTTYTITDKKLTEQTLGVSITVQNSQLRDLGESWYYHQTVVTGNVNLTLKYTNAKYTLIDISKCEIDYYPNVDYVPDNKLTIG